MVLKVSKRHNGPKGRVKLKMVLTPRNDTKGTVTLTMMLKVQQPSQRSYKYSNPHNGLKGTVTLSMVLKVQ